MDQVYLAGEEEDLYSGYDYYNPALDTEDLADDVQFQKAVVKTSHGRRPSGNIARTTFASGIGMGTTARLGTAARMGTAVRGRQGMPSSMGRPITGQVAGDDGPRPMTAIRSVGFRPKEDFDPLNKHLAPPLESKPEDSPEEQMRELERKVNNLIDESCIANSNGEFLLALDKAKEAGRKERMLVRQREQHSLTDNANLDLTYSVLFNLANQYTANEMFAEALNTYQVIVKNRMFSNGGRLKVNMGNIYFRQKNYQKAIKFYRMALDQVPNTQRAMRTKIMQNIGIVFVKMGQFTDAITSFEHIMSESPSFKTGFNLILCYYALGDQAKMRSAFQKLLAVDLMLEDEDKYHTDLDDKQAKLLQEVIKNDALRQIERERQYEAERCIKYAAKIISPAIEGSFSIGYDWCIEQVKNSQHMELSNDLEIDKAIMFLKLKEFQQAIETLKSFEKKDSKVASTAATNLSFLYFLENDMAQADKYAEVAMTADRYNPAALVNKGNVLYERNDFEKAREFFQEALSNDSSCVEALYNLGLSNKKLGKLEDALDAFYKLHAILRNDPQVMYQAGDLHDRLVETTQATEWFMQVIGVVPSDPSVLARLGELYDNDGDKSQAFQYYYDSFRYNPSNIQVIEWLGAYYIESQFCDKAIFYFEQAAIVQPNQVKWHLMIASCYRRVGNYYKALDTYRTIHRKFPENVECLRFLVRLCTDMGLQDAQDYANKLKKAEKIKELRDQQRVSSAGRRGSLRGQRDSNAGLELELGANVLLKGSDRGERKRSIIEEKSDGKPFQASHRHDIDASYSDPLGPQMERPKTAGRRRDLHEDDFDDEQLGDDLLPE